MANGPAALLIDFGSTYTKLRAIDCGTARILGAGQGPSTVTTDVTLGMEEALGDLERRLGQLPDFRYRLASSSAAGGLRMVAVGLVRELTLEAARQAALGAGARLVGTFAYQLTSGDVAAIETLAPDILLLAGGTDGGNAAVILHNAAALAGSALDCPIVAAGNRNATEEVERRLSEAGKTVTVTENVMPEFNQLHIDPTREAIRRIFIERIVDAKGIGRARESFDRVLMPTPAAVLEGARLVAEGVGAVKGLGPLLVVDVGGATTDVHSICSGAPARGDAIVHGLPEPFVKRTVEGDLGMRHSVAAIADAAGRDALAADAGLGVPELDALLARLGDDVGRLPESPDEHRLDHALARAATRIAVRRHAGTVRTVYTPTGPANVQHGKDLGAVATVIGTGGAVAHGRRPAEILEVAVADPADPTSLRPVSPRFLVDRDYVLFSAGLLASVEPEAALRLALGHLTPADEEDRDERHGIA